jgi:hypothetical protein
VSITEPVRRYVWVRSGGRCVICTRYLLLEHLDDGTAVRQIGEVAHIAGESEAGPRGASEVPAAERNDPPNLILLCPNDHRGADKLRLEDPKYTEEFLRALKDRHEAFIEHVTGLRDERSTTVLRMGAMVRDRPGVVTRSEAATVVMIQGQRVPRHRADPYGVGDKIDLTVLGDTVDAGYWTAGLQLIDKVVDRVHRDAAEDGTDHISVFAIALVPLLVALGSKLDDTIAADIYDRHRSRDGWAWNDDRPVFEFAAHPFPDVAEGTSDAVLIVNGSGTVQSGELPDELAGLPVFTIAPAGGATPGPDTFESSATLASFDEAVRSLFAALELDAATKAIRRLHLFAAVPVSAAVTIGRRLPVDNAAPHLALYHRTENTYAYAFDLPTT